MRTKNQFRFAPRVPVRSVQDIEIVYEDRTAEIMINGRRLGYMNWADGYCNWSQMVEKLSFNDGFSSVQDFFRWFDSDFEGQIIHWADLKY
jgi:hypothetical protein